MVFDTEDVRVEECYINALSRSCTLSFVGYSSKTSDVPFVNSGTGKEHLISRDGSIGVNIIVRGVIYNVVPQYPLTPALMENLENSRCFTEKRCSIFLNGR